MAADFLAKLGSSEMNPMFSYHIDDLPKDFRGVIKMDKFQIPYIRS